MRINLSEQTDMMDLLGADLPVEGQAPGHFAWCAAARPAIPTQLVPPATSF